MNRKVKIEWLITGSEKEWVEDNLRSGGRIYDTNTRKILRKHHNLIITYLHRGSSKNRIKRTIEFAQYFQKNRELRFKGDIVVRDPFSTAYAPFDKARKNVILFHHIDVSSVRFRRFNAIFVNRFFKRAVLADCVVVVSEYWKDVMVKKGCSNIKVIYNTFDTKGFEFSDQELSAFIKKLGVPGEKPVIYIGNARPEKGFLEAYEALKNLDVVLIATGKKKVDVPVIQRYLSYSDYLKLLKISSLTLTMSKFDEGWCRSAHEAMLCGTPVVGSGRGGMKELLEKGEQIICSDFNELPQIVHELLLNSGKRDEMGRAGKKFASQFDMKYFEDVWLDLISSICP